MTRHCLMPCSLQRAGGVCECMLQERAEAERLRGRPGLWEKVPLARLRRKRGDTGNLPRSSNG